MDRAGKKKAPRRKRGKEKLFIPDEIITNILIRLPVKCLIRFLLVCKQWRDIILSRDFVDSHRRSSLPVILVVSRRGFNTLAVDKWWDLSRKRTVFYRFPSCAPDFPYAFINHFSHSGLIVVDGCRAEDPERTIIILNPLRPSYECVKIKYSKDFDGDICAVYYHPSLQEYCALWKISISGNSAHEPELFQYKLLNLGSNPSFRIISDASSYRVKELRRRYEYPLLINDRLYWMLESEHERRFTGHNDILELDNISKEFMVIPCPIPFSTKCRWHETLLLNCDGILSFLLILQSKVIIWALKDHELQLWTTTEYTINLDICRRIQFTDVIIGFVNGMLAFEYQGILCVCNLREGTVKKFPKKYGGKLFLSHQMCLPSLMKCKDVLYIDKHGNLG